MFLNRHVLKYILGRKIAWHDLAFMDPIMYESLRSMVTMAESKDGVQTLAGMALCFDVVLCTEEVGSSSFTRTGFKPWLARHFALVRQKFWPQCTHSET